MCTYNKSCSANEVTDVEQRMLEQYVHKLISQSYVLDRGCGILKTRVTWYIFHCHLPWTLSCVPCIQFACDFPKVHFKVACILGFIKSPRWYYGVFSLKNCKFFFFSWHESNLYLIIFIYFFLQHVSDYVGHYQAMAILKLKVDIINIVRLLYL